MVEDSLLSEGSAIIQGSGLDLILRVGFGSHIEMSWMVGVETTLGQRRNPHRCRGLQGPVLRPGPLWQRQRQINRPRIAVSDQRQPRNLRPAPHTLVAIALKTSRKTPK